MSAEQANWVSGLYLEPAGGVEDLFGLAQDGGSIGLAWSSFCRTKLF